MVENKIKGEYKGLGTRSVPTDVMCAFVALARSTDLLVLRAGIPCKIQEHISDD